MDPVSAAYAEAVMDLPAMGQWITEARAELAP
jgi:hypothetical protein